MRKTKIVATIGPATEDSKTLAALVDAGMNVVRQNFSHGTHEEHREIKDRIDALDADVATMVDTQGPEIRMRDIEEEFVLNEGDEVALTAEDITGTPERIAVDYPDLLEYLEEDDMVYIDDGGVELRVKEVTGDAHCIVESGGTVGAHKSVNVPGKDLGLTAPTEQDRKDIRFGARNDFDFLSASFVKTAEDIRKIRELIEDEGGHMDIIAKIEHVRAVENFEAILEEADGIMVARGDLGIEIPISEVPLVQKDIIKKCNKAGKPVITATQMLKSMTDHPRATRAEVSDVANAVIDGTDAVMLSEETAVGKYPVRTVEFMGEVVEKTEGSLGEGVHHTVQEQSEGIEDIICKNIWQTQRETAVKYIVAHTTSGYTARHISKFRPETPIIAFTDTEAVKRKLQLVWGVEAEHRQFPDTMEQMVAESASILSEKGQVDDEDLIVFSAGVPTAVAGTTNMMEIRSVQSLLEENEQFEQ